MASTPELGRLERVELRTAWESEAQDFTPWLAQDENIAVLGETLDMELEVEAQEESVGPFRADILCRDANSADHDSWVLIENQLERTDHTHLGQLLTYASGLHTVTIIWIARRFTDEHRAALDWLNEITDERFRFFGLEVELWKIGGSPAAPKFNIVAKPNEWTRSASEGARRAASGEKSPLRLKYKAYWTSFSDYLEAKGSPLAMRKPLAESWASFSIGRGHSHLEAVVSKQKNRLRVCVTLKGQDAKPHFHLLREKATSIEDAIGSAVDWWELPERQASVISIDQQVADLLNEDDWPRQHAWFADMLERFDGVFRPLVHDLDASDWVPEDTGDDE